MEQLRKGNNLSQLNTHSAMNVIDNLQDNTSPRGLYQAKSQSKMQGHFGNSRSRFKNEVRNTSAASENNDPKNHEAFNISAFTFQE